MTRCDHTMHFVLFVFSCCCCCCCGVCVCVLVAGGILDILKRSKKEHVHKTNKNRELGVWFKPLSRLSIFKTAHCDCEDPDPLPGPVALLGVGHESSTSRGPDVLHSALHGGVCLAALCL